MVDRQKFCRPNTAMRRARTDGQQSLPVGVLPPDFNGVPLDGAQYLAMVRAEAESHPRVMVAAQRPIEGTKPVSAPATNSVDTLPSTEWRTVFIERFRRMRTVSCH